MELIGGKTLQEIQDLPLSEMHSHMREHVDPKWQSWSDADGKIKVYNVTVELTTSENKKFKIEAHSEEEADELAETHIQDNFEDDDYEIYDLSRSR